MRTTRTALQFARLLATALGPQWKAESAGSTRRAHVESADAALEARVDPETRAVTVSLISTWGSRAEPDEIPAAVTATMDDPAATARAAAERIVAPWQALAAVRSGRVEAIREAGAEFAVRAAAHCGPSATVSHGSMPGIAQVRWDAGALHLHTDRAGEIYGYELTLRDLDAPTILRVLQAAQGPAALRPDPLESNPTNAPGRTADHR
ncbi:hypothetical protein [Streptacidiphilus sp. EB103A]|uniref:hypothetical protein n=1 Tax=Streptacidiphilus sp. EB103A TaxID=3156275 RepID=UPI0035167C67